MRATRPKALQIASKTQQRSRGEDEEAGRESNEFIPGAMDLPTRLRADACIRLHKLVDAMLLTYVSGRRDEGEGVQGRKTFV